MNDTAREERPQADRQGASVPLPKLVVARAPADPKDPRRAALWRFLRVARFVPLIMGLVMLGGVIGLYFQPPGLKKFFSVFGLQPGGGTSTPIAVPVDKGKSPAAKAQLPSRVVGLGKLIPKGDVTTLALPFGSADARIATIAVREGDTVEAGAILATLDNEQPIKAAIEASRATVAAREAAFVQTQAQVRASRDEAEAAWKRAKVTLANAEREFERVDGLFKRGVSSSVAADQKRTARDEAQREVERTRATLSRYDNASLDEQPDVIVARRNLEAARADLARAGQDLEKAYVRAPRAGTVLTIHVRPGEKPGAKGVMTLGDIDQMTAELEIYQTQIGRVSVGDPVEIVAEALGRPLEGKVTRIGLEVGRQTVVDPSPAANTDARVVKVDVALGPEASAHAKRFTNLQVTGHITVRPRP